MSNDFFQAMLGDGVIIAQSPVRQSYNLLAGTKTETTEDISWSRGDGAFCMVIGKSGGPVDASPQNGTTYTANASFASGSQIGSGNYVLYIGTGTSLTVTGLSAGTTYYYKVLEFNGTAGGQSYLLLNELGHKWSTQTAPPSGMIGACKTSDNSIYVRSGGNDIYYSTDYGESWTLWATVSGAQFHSCECCEGGTIHNASGSPVTRKFMFNDHGGSGKIYAGYTPGDTPETVCTEGSGATWNEGSWNSSTSTYCAVADSGTNRIATLANARTQTFVSTFNTTQWASVVSTPGAPDSTEFIAVAKNSGVSGFPFMKRVSGVWTLKAGPVGLNYHMVQFLTGLGPNGRIGVVSADDTSTASLYSDDFMETYVQGSLDGSGHTLGGYGAFYYDNNSEVSLAVSRHPNKPYALTYDFITWEYVTNISATSIWFNVIAINGGFSIQASSGTPLGAKTVTSNINNIETRYSDYNNYIAYLNSNTIGLPSGNYIRDFFYLLQDNNLRTAFKFGYFANTQTDKNAVKVNLKTPGTKNLIETGTVVFTSGKVASDGSASYYKTGIIPSTDLSGLLDSMAIFHRVQSNVDGTQWDYGVTGSVGATQRTYFNSRTSNTIAVALNSSTINTTGSNTDSTHRYVNVRTGSTSADHDVWRDSSEWDGSNSGSTSLPDREIYWLAHNNNGTAGFFSTRDQGYLLIFSGLTPTQISTLDAFLATIP